ncbi:TIGR02679 domain-containing protein [uncultured Fusobacterium sp.]|uniref:TIGR02679 domain-containing protein n=1 Tax=uncultured Fusobacterium sp. TaxID=159267 RepID=UPI0015A655CB|nr:TIGR02679 domain-containing protein [uncultured Fusobacterium sp.]
MEKALKECVSYFKNNRGYDKIFQQMREKWISYGKISGNIIVNNPTSEEREAVKKFLGIVSDTKKIKFKMADFEKALKESKFNSIELINLLEEYFQEKIIYQKEEKKLIEEERIRFFENIRVKLKIESIYNKEIEKLLDTIILEKSYLFKYGEDNFEIEKMIFLSLKAVHYLSNLDERVKIAILGAEIAKSPHYFDRGSAAGNFLIYLLYLLFDIEETKGAENILEVYYRANIEVDSVSNYVACFGIRLYIKSGEHGAYREFIKNSEEYLVTLSNLSKIVKADSDNKRVFIVENQMVFSYLCEYFKDKNISFLCTSGQLKTAALILIDMLCEAGCKIYYSGDFDPEGIEIAEKLIQRDKNIVPWCFLKEDYRRTISENIISNERLKKLDKIENICFKELIEEIKKERKAGYQELLLDKMKKDIEEILN